MTDELLLAQIAVVGTATQHLSDEALMQLARAVVSEEHNFEGFDGKVKSLFPHGKVAELTVDALAEVVAQRISKAMFFAVVKIGKRLTDLHANYEQAPMYPLRRWWSFGHRPSWRVEKMRLSPDKTAVIVNESLTLGGIPQECFAYRLGNRSALEWVIGQHQVTEDKKSGIVSDPNRPDEPEYIARLVCRVVYVSVETVRLQHELEQITGPENWIGIPQEDLSSYWKTSN